MMNEQTFANLCLSWMCCLQPLTAFGMGWLVSRYGWRGGASHLLDRIGVPRL